MADERLSDVLSYVIGGSQWISFFIKANILFILIDYAMLHMHNQNVLNRARLDKIVIVRRGITIFLALVTWILFSLLMSTCGDEVLSFMGDPDNMCTEDPIFNATMQDVGEFTNGTGCVWICIIISII